MFGSMLKGNDGKLLIHTASNLSSHSNFDNEKDKNKDNNSVYVNKESFGDSTDANKSAKEKEKTSGNSSSKDGTEPNTKHTERPGNISSRIHLIKDSRGSSIDTGDKILNSTQNEFSEKESWDIPDEAGIPPYEKKQFLKKPTSDKTNLLETDAPEVGLPESGIKGK